MIFVLAPLLFTPDQLQNDFYEAPKLVIEIAYDDSVPVTRAISNHMSFGCDRRSFRLLLESPLETARVYYLKRDMLRFVEINLIPPEKHRLLPEALPAWRFKRGKWRRVKFGNNLIEPRYFYQFFKAVAVSESFTDILRSWKRRTFQEMRRLASPPPNRVEFPHWVSNDDVSGFRPPELTYTTTVYWYNEDPEGDEGVNVSVKAGSALEAECKLIYITKDEWYSCGKPRLHEGDSKIDCTAEQFFIKKYRDMMPPEQRDRVQKLYDSFTKGDFYGG